jgi:hypothetical protein
MEFYKFVGNNFKTQNNPTKGKYTSLYHWKDGGWKAKTYIDIGFGTGEEAIRILKLCQVDSRKTERRSVRK